MVASRKRSTSCDVTYIAGLINRVGSKMASGEPLPRLAATTPHKGIVQRHLINNTKYADCISKIPDKTIAYYVRVAVVSL